MKQKIKYSYDPKNLYGDRIKWPYFIMKDGSLEKGISPSSLTKIITEPDYNKVPQWQKEKACTRGRNVEKAILKFIETQDYNESLKYLTGIDNIKNTKRAFDYLKSQYLDKGYKLYSYQATYEQYPFTCQKDIEIIGPEKDIITLEIKTNNAYFNIPLVFKIQLFIQAWCSPDTTKHYLFWIKNNKNTYKRFKGLHTPWLKKCVKELLRIYKLNLEINEAHKLFMDFLKTEKINEIYWKSKEQRGLPKNGKKIKCNTNSRTT